MKVKNFALVVFSVLAFGHANAQQSSYTGVPIGGQIWMSTNLDVTKFRNGDKIRQAQSDEEWEEAGFDKKPAWCYYNLENDTGGTDIVKRGIMYNSFAVNDKRGLAPVGWHIPTEGEWNNLQFEVEIQGPGIASLFSNNLWASASGEFNSLGMNISPDGWRDVGCGGLDRDVTFWAKKVSDEGTPTVGFHLEEESIGKMDYGSTTWIMGHYVRCVKD
jgi:hypothetical protein